MDIYIYRYTYIIWTYIYIYIYIYIPGWSPGIRSTDVNGYMYIYQIHGS